MYAKHPFEHTMDDFLCAVVWVNQATYPRILCAAFQRYDYNLYFPLILLDIPLCAMYSSFEPENVRCAIVILRITEKKTTNVIMVDI